MTASALAARAVFVPETSSVVREGISATCVVRSSAQTRERVRAQHFATSRCSSLSRSPPSLLFSSLRLLAFGPLLGEMVTLAVNRLADPRVGSPIRLSRPLIILFTLRLPSMVSLPRRSCAPTPERCATWPPPRSSRAGDWRALPWTPSLGNTRAPVGLTVAGKQRHVTHARRYTDTSNR